MHIRSPLAAVALALMLGPASVAAQGPGGLAVGAEATYWRLGGGGLTTVDSRWGPTVHAGTYGGRLGGLDLRASLSWAPEASFTPGLLGGAVELVAYGWRPAPARRLNVALRGGMALLDVRAGNAERALAGCTPERFCLYEGTTYRSGLRAAAQIGVGLELGLTERLWLQPVAQLVAPTGLGHGGPTGADLMLRAGIGALWR